MKGIFMWSDPVRSLYRASVSMAAVCLYWGAR